MSPVTLDLEVSKKNLSTRCALDDISKAVCKCKRIVVVTGAGISCSSGIPDFRSSDGLYNLVKARFPDVVLKGRDLFDASLFRDPDSTAAFFWFISQLKQKIDQAEPTPTHDFLKILESKGKLLRSYTQNIDGMEERVGLIGNAGSAASSSGKSKGKGKCSTLKQCRNVQLHGDIHRVRCQTCSADFPCTQDHLKLFDDGRSPHCPECLQRSNARVARSARALRVGLLRPAIVLYDEAHPLGDEIGIVQSSDVARKPDMLIIMGTSLKVHGLKKLVKEFARVVHNQKSSSVPLSSSSSPLQVRKASSAKAFAGKVIFVNKTPPGAEWADVIDYHVSGETDKWTQRVVEDWKRMFPGDWEFQQTLLSSGLFKTVKETHNEAEVIAKGNGKGTAKAAKDAMILSTPDAHRPLKLKPTNNMTDMVISPAPVSPSKRARTQSQSHYSAAAQASLEASPSKRRIKPLPDSGVEFSEFERRILFGKITMNQAGVDNDEAEEEDDVLNLGDLSMQSPPKLKPSLRSTAVKPIPKSRAGARRAALVVGNFENVSWQSPSLQRRYVKQC
ncbi:DHS-like NAD/FAD-binding domain-containing protein [Lentinula lateritia]|uniref:DHS-like NAD/FAD-binding domain-containing protein n=1 Tax=Lentinula aff. lateritia TaxID=2804960 RepID=A0ACC1TRJ9_9AGAR|nr:DHS-like NAD/FAD-binding domain-containing protein [Lentinula aff. lateritia]KAJ3849211.1 DHS-like NAD/FAD-binding domain-containing protein [Lentinula lateritia]